MLRIKSIIPALAVLVVCGAASASAYATPVWLVKGKTLEASETGSAIAKFGKLTVTWEDKVSKASFEAECKKASGKVELKGGNPGTDKVKALTFEECALVKGASGCKMKAGGVSAEELPGWPTKLEIDSGKTYDSGTGIKFSLILEGCETVGFNKTWLFKGVLKAEAKNGIGKINLILPAVAVEGDTLESEGARALLAGEGELEEEGGGTLEFKEAAEACSPKTPAYCIAGVELTGSEEETIESETATTIFKDVGAGVEFTCKTKETGTIKAGGKGTGRFEFSSCSVQKPSTSCKINEPFVFETESNLIEFEGKLADRFTPKGGEIFTTLRFESCSLTESEVSGQITALLAEEPAVTNEFSFTSTSGSNLEWALGKLGFRLKDKIKLSGINKGESWVAKK